MLLAQKYPRRINGNQFSSIKQLINGLSKFPYSEN